MSTTTRVYVGRLSSSVRDTDIQKFFRNYGKIREILLKDGYGFVEFDDKRDAEDAVYDMNGKELCGERVIVEHAKPPGSGRGRGGGRGSFDRYSAPGRSGGYGVRGGGYAGFRSNSSSAERYRPRPPAVPRTEYRIIVDNLSSRTSWQDLKDYMRKGGEVIYADAHKRRPNQGVVEFASSEDMRRAIEKLDDTELNGRRIKITEDRGHSSSRSRKRSRSRSSSHSRSRSRSHHSRDRSRSRSPRSNDRRSPRSSDRRSPRSSDRRSPRSNDRSRSRSGDNRNRSRSPSHGNDKRSRSQSQGNERSVSRSRTPERNKSRSRSPDDNRSRSRSQDGEAAS